MKEEINGFIMNINFIWLAKIFKFYFFNSTEAFFVSQNILLNIFTNNNNNDLTFIKIF